ncbi:hypothetical protein [Treponema sp. C6A8]|uniref:hypothetical protein n=1 Tax=Treponema sp. C6A8 TaxID=1410609 RepID=UPI0004883E88|nr:hypothetical protein [Treponema sp. C6A8]
MLILIAIILFVSAMSDFAAAHDWEASEHNAELRHLELLEEQRQLARKRKSQTVTRRRFIKDKHGNILAEEIIVDDGDYEEDEDYDDDDFVCNAGMFLK